MRQITALKLGPLMTALMIAVASLAHAGEYHVDTTAPRVVKFTSKAPIESFDGVTSRIDGFAMIPSDTLQDGAQYDSSKFYFEVDLNALDTGIGLRNRHMRENYLQTDQFPFAQYGGRLTEVVQAADGAQRVATTGELTIHGAKRTLADTILVARDGRRYHVRCQFPVALPDYKIKVPKLMFMKISDTVQVQLDFYLLPVAGTREGQ